MADEDDDDLRGREAEGPLEMPKLGWRDALLRVKAAIAKDHLDIVAAGVAFYALLAFFPALAAALSLYGLVADPLLVAEQITALSAALPEAAEEIVASQLTRVATGGEGALSLGVIAGLLGSLWSAGRGIKTLIDGLNIVYGEAETRSFLYFNALALALTLLSIVAVLLAIALIGVLPAAMGLIGLGGVATALINAMRWPLLGLGVMVWLAVVYRLGPCRATAQWRWVSLGSVVATTLWMAASAGFSAYVDQFGNYNETYGALGGVIVLMLWLWLTAYLALLGAELNSELEHQTTIDSTTGDPRPMGERGAFVADTLGETP